MFINKSVINKKVCHVTSAHNRYDVRIFHKECKSLAKHGYCVILLVNDDIEDEFIDGVKIESTNFKPKNRYERMVVSQKKIRDKAINIDASIYHFHDPELLPLALFLKRKGKKVIFDFHEDVPRQIKDKPWIPSRIRNTLSYFYEVYEKRSIKNFDAVISVTPQIIGRLMNTNRNTVQITNYPIINKDEKIKRKPKRAICFAGGITDQYRHHNILKAIEEIEDIKYFLAGTGSKEYLGLLKNLSGWNKVDYKGRIPFLDVKEIYSQSAVGVAIHRSTQLGKTGSLGVIKLFEFMEAQLPVICTNYSIWAEMINKYKCGICVDPDNVDEIRDAIKFILNNPKKAEKMGENGRKAVLEEFNWDLQEVKLINLYGELLRKQ